MASSIFWPLVHSGCSTPRGFSLSRMSLTVIAVIPSVMHKQFNIPWLVASFLGGTSLLIIVGVALDTMRQVESHLLMRHYDGFLKKGKLRARR